MLGIAALLACSTAARAGEPSPVPPRPAASLPIVTPSYKLFSYAKPLEVDHFRVALEEIASFGAGLVQYFQEQDANVGDWDLSFSADSFSRKIGGKAITYDSNKYGTNWATHPMAGWLYYSNARGNRLSPLGSLFVASWCSTLWEFLGEYRELASINDLIVTPLGGASLAEPMLQLGAWYERGRPTVGRTAMAWLFASPKRIHDAVDRAQPLRSPDVERGELDARLTAGGGPSWSTFQRSARPEMEAGVRTHLFFGPGLRKPGSLRTWLDDGNLSSMHISSTFTDQRMVDLRMGTRVSFLGYVDRNVYEREPKQPRGHNFFLGVGTGFDYQFHEYDHGGVPRGDQIALVELFGTTLESSYVAGRTTLRARLILAADFAGVRALSLSERQAKRGNDGLATVVIDNGYSHSLGATIGPSFTLSLPLVTAFGEARLDAFRSILGRDRHYDERTPTVIAADTRFEANAGLEREVLPGFSLAAKVSRRYRRSRLDEILTSFGETALRLDTVFSL